MSKQPIKKKEAKRFDIEAFKNKTLKIEKVAEKPIEWFIMPEGFQEALSLPDISQGAMGGIVQVRVPLRIVL